MVGPGNYTGLGAGNYMVGANNNNNNNPLMGGYMRQSSNKK
jgi:hypothetical protein